MGDAPSRLILQASRTKLFLLLVLPPVAAAAGMIWADMARDRGFWVFLIAGPLLAMGLFGAVSALYPIRLIADASGLTYTSLWFRRAIPWADVEAIGVARDRAYDGWDGPSVRLLYDRPPSARARPMIGISYKPGRSPEKDAGKRAYYGGFTGYDLNLPSNFHPSVGEIVAALNARREAALAASDPPASPTP